MIPGIINQAVLAIRAGVPSSAPLYVLTNYVAMPARKKRLDVQSSFVSLAPVITTSTWNNSDKSANIILSNSNLTAGGTAASDSGVRGTTSHNSGKYYVEWTTGSMAGADTGVGIATSTATLTSIGAAGAGGFVTFSSGSIYFNGSNTGVNTGFSNSNTIVCMAIDFGNSKGWFRTANNNWNNDVIANQNPATNTGGVNIAGLFPTNAAFLLFCTNANGTAATLNTGSVGFTYVVPSGFSAWG